MEVCKIAPEAAAYLADTMSNTLSRDWDKRHELGQIDELFDIICNHASSDQPMMEHLEGFNRVTVSRNRKTLMHTDPSIGLSLVCFLQIPEEGGALVIDGESVLPEEPTAYLLDLNKPHMAEASVGNRLVVVFYRRDI